MSMCLNISGRVANGVDPDQMPHSAASDLGLHCLLRHVCLNTLGSIQYLLLAFSNTRKISKNLENKPPTAYLNYFLVPQ